MPADGTPPLPAPAGWTDEFPRPPAAPLPDNGVKIDPPGTAFIRSQTVTLTARVPDAVIHYTTDDTLPTRSSPVARGPLSVTGPTVVRAFVESASLGDGAPAAAAFLPVADDAAAFTSDLPIVVLHTHGAGMLPLLLNTYLEGSASVFEPDASGRAHLVGTATVTGRAGVRIRGNSSRAFPQKSYAFETRGAATDDDEDRWIARLPGDSDYALVAPSWVDRSLIRTAVAFHLANDMGQYAPRVRMVEAFVVDTGGAVSMKGYQGVFALTEKIKRGKNRVNVEKLDPTIVAAPAISGGYIFRIDHEANDFTAGGINFGFVYPDASELMMPGRQAQKTYLAGYLQEFADALAAPAFKNPRTGKAYGEYVDVPSFIDYDLVNALVKSVDAFRYSTYFHKERNGLVKAGPLWDVDRSSGSPYDDQARDVDPREWARGDAANPLTYGWWGRFQADPVFKAAYVKRWKELAAGPCSVPAIQSLIDRYAAQVAEASKRHFTAWPSMAPTGGSLDGEVKILRDWFAARVPWMTSQIAP